MHNADCALEMLEGRDILVVPAWCAVVGEAQSLPLPEMHVQETLICAIEANASLRKCKKRVVVLQVRPEDHNARIETVGPSNVGHSGKAGVKCEELVGSPKGYCISIKIHNLSILGLSPELDL